MRRTRARVDQNQAEIVAAFRGYGWRVHSTAALGKGFPDLLVQKHETLLVEVKQGKGTLTADQEAFLRQGWRVEIVRTVEDVARLSDGRI